MTINKIPITNRMIAETTLWTKKINNKTVPTIRKTTAKINSLIKILSKMIISLKMTNNPATNSNKPVMKKRKKIRSKKKKMPQLPMKTTKAKILMNKSKPEHNNFEIFPKMQAVC